MPKMTPSEAFVETLVAHGVKNVFGIVGSAYMDALDLFPTAGIRFIPTVHEQGAGHMADGYARVSGPPWRVHRPERPRHHQFRDLDRRRLLGALAGRRRHARDRLRHHGARRLPGDRPAADLLQDHQVPGACEQASRAWPRSPARCFDMAMAERGPTQLNIPRDYFYGETDYEIAKPQRVARGPGAEESLDEAADLLAKAKFPVIVWPAAA